MSQPAPDFPFSPRERLRWRRAMDARLIDSIFNRVVRDETPPPLPVSVRDRFAPPAGAAVR